MRYDLTGFEWRVVEPGDRGVAAKSANLRIFCAAPLPGVRACPPTGALGRVERYTTRDIDRDEILVCACHKHAIQLRPPRAPLPEVTSVGRGIFGGLAEGFPRLHRAGEKGASAMRVTLRSPSTSMRNDRPRRYRMGVHPAVRVVHRPVDSI